MNKFQGLDNVIRIIKAFKDFDRDKEKYTKEVALEIEMTVDKLLEDFKEYNLVLEQKAKFVDLHKKQLFKSFTRYN